jgi:hypothetical protein
MNKLILTIFLILIASPALAEYKFAQDWHWQDTVLEGAFAAEVAVDLGQTLYIEEHPKEYYEAVNPFLPRHPTKDQVWGACIIGAGLHAIVSMALKPVYHIEIGDWKHDFHARTWWQGTTIVSEGGNTIRNKTVGIGWGF